MSQNQGKLVGSYFEKTLSIVPTTRWGSIPGIVPAKTVDRRRAKNKAARHSRAKNR
jgi:hypothetical protein